MTASESASCASSCSSSKGAPLDTLESPEAAGLARARRHLTSFVNLSPEQITAQIEDRGDEELLFALADALLDLQSTALDLEKLRCSTSKGCVGGRHLQAFHDARLPSSLPAPMEGDFKF